MPLSHLASCGRAQTVSSTPRVAIADIAGMWSWNHRPGTYMAQLIWALLLPCGDVETLRIETSPLVIAKLGKEANLSVSYESQVNPRVTWQIEGRGIVAWWQVGSGTSQLSPHFQNRLVVDTSKASLNFNRTELADSGKYDVTLEVLGEQPVTSRITLTVHELITGVGMSIPAVIVKEGDPNITLTCTRDTGTVGSLIWRRNGNLLPSDAHFQPASNVLTIRGVLRSDTGEYSCFLKNPFSNGSAKALLHVFYGPDIPVINITSTGGSTASQFVLVNDKVTLTCATSSMPSALYYWNVGDSTDPSVPSDPVLVLPRIQRDQAGRYTCIVVNSKIENRKRTSVTLSVYELPLGNLSCSMEALANGKGLSLSCWWPGGFPRVRLLWEGLAQGVSAEEKLQVNVTAPAPLDQTSLTCVGSHPTGTRTCTVRPASPGLDLSLRVSTDVRGFAVVAVSCRIVANPPAAVRWYRESRELGSEAIVNPEPATSELRIQDFLLANHTGNYSCRAENPLGVSQQGLELTAPLLSNFLLVRLNGSAVRFSWAQRRSDVVTSFRLQSRDGDRASRADVWQTWSVVDMSQRQAILSGLKADRGYTFRVLPMVGLQEGVPSQPLSVNPAQSQTLSAGAIIGIVLGCVGGILLLALIIVFIIWFRGHRKQTRMSKRQGGIQSNAAVTRRTRERQPAELYQAGPLTNNAQSNSKRQAQSTEDWDSQSTVYSVTQNVTPAASGRHPKQDISPQTTLPSSVKPVNTNSYQSSDKPSNLTLQRRKATMV